MSDNLNAVVNQDTLSPLAQIAAAGQGLFGLSSLLNLIPSTISAANAPQFPDQPDPIRPSPVTTQMTPFIRGKPGTQSGFAVPNPNALPNVKPGTPLSANTAGIPGLPGAQSGTATSGPQPDRSYNPTLAPPAPRPVSKLPPVVDPPHPDDPVTPGRPGAPTPESISRQQQIVDDMQKVVDRLLNPPPGPTLNLERLPSPPPIQQQQSWMSTILSSAGLVLATLGARRSAAPMTAAIKSFGGYLQGYQEGNKEVAQQQYQNYQDQLKIAIERNKEEMEGYRATLEANKDNAAELKDALYGMSLINENEHAQAMLEQGKLKDFEQYQLGMQQHTLELQRMWLKAQEYNAQARIAGLPTIDLGPYPTGLGGDAIDNAIRGQEGSGPESVSPKGARGGMQIIRTTFEQYKQPGESYDSEQDRTAAAERYLAHLKQLYPGDPARIAVAYFSGEDNVSPPGSPTPWKEDKDDGTPGHPGTKVSNYVSGVLSRLGGQQTDGTSQQVDGKPQPTSTTGGTGGQIGGLTQEQINSQATNYLETGQLPNLGSGTGVFGEANFLARRAILQKASEMQAQMGAIEKSNLTGADAMAALQKIDPSMGDFVQAVIDGRYPPPSSFSMKIPYWRQVLAIATKIDPTIDATTFATRATTYKSFASGPDGRNLTSIGTALGHLKTLETNLAATSGTGVGILNIPFNAAVHALGQGRAAAALAAYKTTQEAVADELARAFTSTGGALADRTHWLAKLSPDSTGTEIRATIEDARALLRSRVEALQERFEDGSGKPASDMIKLFRRYKGETAGPISSAIEEITGAQKRPSPATNGGSSADNLPDGTIATQGGVRYLKQNGQWKPIGQ